MPEQPGRGSCPSAWRYLGSAARRRHIKGTNGMLEIRSTYHWIIQHLPICASCPQRSIGRHMDAVLLAVLDGPVVGEIWGDLDLIVCWRHMAVSDGLEMRHAEVGHTDRTHFACAQQFLSHPSAMWMLGEWSGAGWLVL